MTPELIIVKIQSLLASFSDCSQAQMRSIAMEYCKQCAQTQELLEHCAAMVKAGREYSALEFAESCGLLDRINTLSFAEEKIWADFCAENELPLPMSFDSGLIEIVSSLYQKSISQTHPLYRDYRRAMRLRDFDKALSVITTISKINVSDTSAKEECARLRKSVVERKLERLAQLVNSDNPSDLEEFESVCSFLEKHDDYTHGKPQWNEALLKRASVVKAGLYKRGEEILDKLKELTADGDLDEIVSLLSEINSMPEDVKFAQEDAEFIDSVSQIALKRQGERIAREKSQKASAMIAQELENPTFKNISGRLSNLKKLRSQAGQALGAETAKVLDKEISKMKVALFVRNLSICLSSVVILSMLGYLGFVLGEDFYQKNEQDKCIRSLNSIALIDNPRNVLTAVAELERRYAKFLQEPAIRAKIEHVKTQATASEHTIARLEKLLDFAQNLDFSTASARQCSEALEAVEKVSDDVHSLPLTVQASIKSRLGKVHSRVDNEIEIRKLQTGSLIRKLLAEYEELLRDYESFSKNRKQLDSRFDSLSAKLRVLMEETSHLLRPHQIDIDKYNDISGRITEAKSRYSDFDQARKSLISSKTFSDYIAVAKLLKVNPFIPTQFYKKLVRVFEQVDKIKFGQLADFASEEATDYAERVGEFARSPVNFPKMIADVYSYNRANGKQILVLGKAIERENVWAGGRESMQRVSEILESGSTNQVLYRQHQIDGKIPTGEKLSGEMLTPESKFAQEVMDIAATDSVLKALEVAVSGNVNAVFKLMLERFLFEQMRKNPIYSGLVYSKTALAREALVNKYSRDFGVHSWIFEKGPRKNFIEKELYSNPIPDLKKEAKICIASIIEAKKNRLKMIGVVLDNGERVIFADPIGAIWAVDSSGTFRKVAPKLATVGSIAELSPIFTEIKSSQEIMLKVAKDIK